jgi:nicotinate-nucleotide pyrophosphorylase (carboxylating)
MTGIAELAAFDDLLDRAIAEDLGQAGDCTSQALFSESDTAEAVIRSKEPGILSGAFLLTPLFSKIDPTLAISLLLADGSQLAAGSEICRIAGPVRGILAGERIALNLLQRLSGIATLTARYCAAIAHTQARLLDTRKTTPGLRLLEKQAVRHGGGMNHRFGLFDMMLIKDTHVKRCGGVTAALGKALRLRAASLTPAIEVEVRSIPEFDEALSLLPDRIMLDNMPPEAMRRCAERKRNAGAAVELEASGNVTLDTIAAVAETGVDFISCGAITHSARAIDIHLVIA